MTNPRIQNQPPAPEVPLGTVEAIVKEWRQVAIAEGIAPTKVDAYLLSRVDVPEDAKVYIRKHLSGELAVDAGVSGVPTVPEVSPAGVESLDEKSSDRVVPKAKTAEKSEIKGDVDMLDSRSEIEAIKREVIEPSESEVQRDGLEKIEERPSTQPDTEDTSSHEEIAERKSMVGSELYGYAPSEQVAQNVDEIAEKGPISDAKTWQAVLLRRFLQIWGSFKGLFSGQ